MLVFAAKTIKLIKMFLLMWADVWLWSAVCLQDVSRAKLAALLPETVVAPSVPALKDEVDRKPEYPKPDTNQMIPFQPRHLART